MNTTEIFRGNVLAPGEEIVWAGRPTYRGIARGVYHVRGMGLYFLGLVGLDAVQAWSKGLPLGKAIHDSVPLLMIMALAAGIVFGLACLTWLTTHYTITTRRVIMKYGMALTATLSLPYRQIVMAEVTIHKDHSGDIPLTLDAGNHMPYLKLWPLARPWALAHPQPMLRAVPRAALVGGLLSRALSAARQPLAVRPDLAQPAAMPSVVAERELLSA